MYYEIIEVEKLIRQEAQPSALSGFETTPEFNKYTSINGALTGFLARIVER